MAYVWFQELHLVFDGSGMNKHPQIFSTFVIHIVYTTFDVEFFVVRITLTRYIGNGAG